MKRFIYIFLILPFFSFAQIQINEFLADNDNCCLDDFGETEDFVEIINLSGQPFDLSGYYFGDLNGNS